MSAILPHYRDVSQSTFNNNRLAVVEEVLRTCTSVKVAIPQCRDTQLPVKVLLYTFNMSKVVAVKVLIMQNCPFFILHIKCMVF